MLAIAFDEYRYRCIVRVSGSVGPLLCCDSHHSSKWLSMGKVLFLVSTKFKHVYYFLCDGQLSYQN